MAIAQGTGAGQGQKKKKKEEHGRQPLPQQAQPRPKAPPIFDAESRAEAVSRAYYARTGKLPSADKLLALTGLTDRPNFKSQEDFDDLFPDWVGELGDDPDDFSPVQLFADKAAETFRAMEARGEIPKSAAWYTDINKVYRRAMKQKKEARQAEEKAERTEEARREAELAAVAPTGTMEEKAGVVSFLEQGAGTKFGWQDTEAGELVARFSADAAKRRVLEATDVVMDPDLIQKLRGQYFRKDRGDLSREQRQYLDEFSQKLANAYPDFAGHYGFDTENVRWDPTFDAYFTRYVVEANLAWVVIDSPLDKDGEIRKAAWKNIMVATQDERLTPDMPVYELLKRLGYRGDPDNPLRASDELTEQLFAGYYNGRRENWTAREALIAWAADFGEDYVPASLKKEYDDYMKDWNPHIDAGLLAYQMRVEQEAVAIARAKEEPLEAGIAPGTPAYVATQPELMKAEGEKGREYAMTALAGSVMSLIASVEGTDIRTDFEFTPETTRIKGRQQAAAGVEEYSKEMRSRLIRELVLPAAGFEPPKEEWAQALGVAEEALQGYYKVSQSVLWGMTKLGYLADVAISPGLRAVGAAREAITGEEYEPPPDMPLPPTQVHPRPADFGNWANYMNSVADYNFSLLGLHTDFEHSKVAMYTTDFIGGLAVDAMVDAGIGALAKFGVKGAAKATREAVARGILSPAQRSGVRALESRIADLKSLELELGGKIDSGIDVAASTEKLGKVREGIGVAQKKLDDRLAAPLWYHTQAEALANGKQSPEFLKMFLDHSDDGLGGIKAGGKIDDIAKADEIKAVDDIYRRIGESTDGNEIDDLFTALRTKHGVNIDSGALMFDRMRAWSRTAQAADGMGGLTRVLPKGMRYADAVNHPWKYMPTIWAMTKGGLEKIGPEDAAKFNELLKRASAAEGKTGAEIAANRRGAWDDFCQLILDNLKSRPYGPGKDEAVDRFYRFANKWSGAGVDMDKVMNMHDLWKATQAIKAGGKGGRGARVAKMAKMYNPIEEIDPMTGVAKIVEGSKVANKEAADIAADKFLRAEEVFQDLAMRKNVGGKELEFAKAARDQAEADWKLARAAAKAKPEPFLEGQLARDLVLPFDPFELAAFNSKGAKWDVFSHLGLLGGMGPSIHGGTTAFRTFVLGRMGFAATALLGDEFWRRIPEGTWGTIFKKNGEYRAMKATLKDRKLMSKAAADEITLLMNHSTAMVGVTSKAPDYPLFLNGYIEMLRNQEHFVDLVNSMPRIAGETNAAYRTRLTEAFDDLVFGEEWQGATVREHLRQMGRLPHDPKAMRVSRAAAEKAETEYSRAYFETEQNLARQMELRKAVGKTPKPGKQFMESWLKARGLSADALSDKALARQLKDDYVTQLMERRGVSAQYTELQQAKQEAKVLRAERNAAKAQRDAALKYSSPGALPEYEKWVDDYLNRVLAFDNDPALSEALRTGRKLSNKEVKEAVARLEAKGISPPVVIGTPQFPRFQEGYIPGISEWAEWGPFRLLDRWSTGIRQQTFTAKAMKHYDELIELGNSEDVAIARAAHYAERETDRAMFTDNQALFEYLTRDIAMFQPAYRQFAVYWAKQAFKHPLVMNKLREKFGSEFPAIRIPGTDYEMMLPLPFWMQGDLSESSMPGFAPLVVMPMRAANYATGWDWDDENETYRYTGATDLDFVSKFPALSFVSRSSTPTMWFDDLLWGILPDTIVPGDEGTFLSAMLRSLPMAFFKDPKKREQFAMNIAAAQISHGIKPDFTKGVEEMREKPGWWRFMEWFGFIQNPDAILSGAARTLNPLTGRVWYEPGDERAKEGDRPFWEEWSGSTPRTMADAYWEYSNAYGDQKKMDEVLRKFPRFAQVQKFWDMDIEEREAFLSNDKNLWITPYITGKYYYENGLPLVGGEFWNAMKQGGIYRKSVDGYLDGIQQTFLDIGWTRTVKKLERDHKKDMKAADAFARQAIRDAAGGNKMYAEKLMNAYKAYHDHYQTQQPGTRYTSPKMMPPAFLVNAARKAGIEDQPFLWDVGAIQKRMNDSYELVSDGGKRLEAHGKQAAYYGVKDHWTNKSIWNKKDYEENLGASLRLADTLKKYVSPNFQPLIDPKYSAYWKDIKDILKSDAEYNSYLTKQLASNEYWMIPNTAALLAIGVDLPQRNKTEQGLEDLNKLYWDFRAKVEGLDTWDSEYKRQNAIYKNERNKLLSKPYMEVFRDGPAGRLFYSLGKGGRGVDKNYMKHVIAVMNKDIPNVGKLVDDWVFKNPVKAVRGSAMKRAAWATLTAVAKQYRQQLKGKWNPYTGTYGYSPEAKAAEEYLRKLRDYAIMWSRACNDFRKEYEDLGGENLLKTMLDPNS